MNSNSAVCTNSMVTYVTQVVVELPHDIGGEEAYSMAKLQSYIEQMQQQLARVHKIVAVLQQQGFKLLRRKNRIIAYADDVEAFAIKKILHDAGISNHEFSIHLDYTRRWGVL